MNQNNRPLVSECFTEALYFGVVIIGLLISMVLGSMQQQSVFKPVPYALGSVDDTQVQEKVHIEHRIQTADIRFAENEHDNIEG